jgi:hypothetical protein
LKVNKHAHTHIHAHLPPRGRKYRLITIRGGKYEKGYKKKLGKFCKTRGGKTKYQGEIEVKRITKCKGGKSNKGYRYVRRNFWHITGGGKNIFSFRANL